MPKSPSLPAAAFVAALTLSASGQVLREYWTGISGTTVATLTATANYQNDLPTGRDLLTNLEAVSWTDATVKRTWANSYGQRLRGYLIAPTTGNYTFWISSDDSSQLWLSPDAEPKNKSQIAAVNGYAGYLVWSGKSSPISLQAGKRYFFEVLHKEGGGNDHLAVGWSKPGQSTTAPSEIIPGSVLEPYAVPVLNADQRAARFLQQATFGATLTSIGEFKTLGIDGWLNAQFAKPVGDVSSVLQRHYSAYPSETFLQHFGHALVERMFTSEDQLRQRVAFALSQIMVVSQRDNTLQNQPRGVASYYDMLLKNAFGNFRTLLYDVAMHPIMGHYLSHKGNRKANLTVGRFPDENFAREIMQLFSIGLYQLDANGEYLLDGSGKPIPTYTNVEITNFARVFTGLGHADGSSILGGGDWINPMKMWDNEHDADAKTLLSYSGSTTTNLPAGRTGMQDVNSAIDNLFKHPNTAPFISRLLIQHLVTSNPTSAYVGRVATAFRTNNGDMKAVIRAILKDDEARDVMLLADKRHGRKRDPWTEFTAMARAFNVRTSSTAPLPYGVYDLDADFGMFPMRSPSVFNFYLPIYQLPGKILENDLASPEFQIHTAYAAIATQNHFLRSLTTGLNKFGASVTLDLTYEQQLASNPGNLVKHVDLLLNGGTMSGRSRDRIAELVGQIPSTAPLERARMAIYLVMIAPEFHALK